jgi:serine/threonine-protein kinase
MIGKTVSHYKILEKIGGGGMGVVYKARDLKLDRTVALKFLPPQLGADEKEKKRFIREAKTVSSLDHPNICTVHEIDETREGQMFLVMACYEGETLKEKIEHGPIPVEEALELAQQTARGLAKAHNQGIVHRDLKPANIFITKDGVVKILDFGLAKLAGQTRLTKTGSTMGTVAYMSPEQARGEDVDQRTDIWSLGVVLHEMVTGKVPFRGEYEQAVIYSILNEEPKGMADIPESLRPVIQKSLEKNREDRYPDIRSMLDDLSGKKRPGKKTGVFKKRAFAKPRRMSSVVLGVAGVIIFGLAMALGVRKLLSPGPLKKLVIAVMPFENRLDPEDEDSTCRTIQDAIIMVLGESRHINVISYD